MTFTRGWLVPSRMPRTPGIWRGPLIEPGPAHDPVERAGNPLAGRALGLLPFEHPRRGSGPPDRGEPPDPHAADVRHRGARTGIRGHPHQESRPPDRRSEARRPGRAPSDEARVL